MKGACSIHLGYKSDIASVHTSMEHSHYLEADNQVHSQSQNSPHSEQPEGCKRRSHLSLFWVRCIFTISHYISCSSVLIFPLRLGFASSSPDFPEEPCVQFSSPYPFVPRSLPILSFEWLHHRRTVWVLHRSFHFMKYSQYRKMFQRGPGLVSHTNPLYDDFFLQRQQAFCFIWDILVCISDHKSIFIQYPLHTTGVKTVLQARSESWK